MTRQEFDILAEKYNAGKCTPEEAALLEKWAELHHRRHIEQPYYKTAEEVQENENRVWERIRDGIGDQRARKQKRMKWLFTSGIAAAILLGLWGGWFGMTRTHTGVISSETVPAGLESRNTTGLPQKIILPDCSAVWLERGASIIAGEDFGTESRIVFLKGEALFEVEADSTKPFFVYSGELVTEVLGTSFRIRPELGNKTIEVSVLTGKVSIYTERRENRKKRDGVIITPNQKAVYDTESQTIRPDLVDKPEVLVETPVRTLFEFDDTPVQTVLKRMQETYGVDIIVGNVNINRCVFTGDLNGLELYEQLDYLCEVINAKYEVRGTAIFVTGSGCGRSR